MDIGQLISDIGFPAVVVLLMWYAMRDNNRSLKAIIDADSKRALAAAEARKSDDNQLSQTLEMVGNFADAVNKQTEVIQKLVEVNQKHLEMDQLQQQQNADTLQKLDASIAGGINDRARIEQNIKDNTAAINGVNTTLEGVKSEIGELRILFQDTQSRADIQEIMRIVSDLQARYAEQKRKCTSEVPAAETEKKS